METANEDPHIQNSEDFFSQKLFRRQSKKQTTKRQISKSQFQFKNLGLQKKITDSIEAGQHLNGDIKEQLLNNINSKGEFNNLIKVNKPVESIEQLSKWWKDHRNEYKRNEQDLAPMLYGQNTGWGTITMALTSPFTDEARNWDVEIKNYAKGFTDKQKAGYQYDIGKNFPVMYKKVQNQGQKGNILKHQQTKRAIKINQYKLKEPQTSPIKSINFGRTPTLKNVQSCIDTPFLRQSFDKSIKISTPRNMDSKQISSRSRNNQMPPTHQQIGARLKSKYYKPSQYMATDEDLRRQNTNSTLQSQDHLKAHLEFPQRNRNNEICQSIKYRRDVSPKSRLNEHENKFTFCPSPTSKFMDKRFVEMVQNKNKRDMLKIQKQINKAQKIKENKLLEKQENIEQNETQMTKRLRYKSNRISKLEKNFDLSGFGTEINKYQNRNSNQNFRSLKRLNVDDSMESSPRRWDTNMQNSSNVSTDQIIKYSDDLKLRKRKIELLQNYCRNGSRSPSFI